MLPLFGFILLVYLCISVNSTYGQLPNNSGHTRNNKNEDGPYIGFTVGLNYCLPRITQNEIENNEEPFKPKGDRGTSFGVMAEFNLSDHFSLVTRPMVVFNAYTVQFVDWWGNSDIHSIDFVYVELPLVLKYVPFEWQHIPFITLGPNPAFHLQRFQDVIFFVDASIGIDLDLKGFFIVPEIKYSIGTSNVKSVGQTDHPSDREVVKANMLHFMVSLKI
jgi:hypothetical protein